MAEAQLTNQLTRIDSMTNVELRAELKKRGCPTSGNKKDLIAKLRAALQKEYDQTGVDTTPGLDGMNYDGRNSHHSGLQQSPVVPFDVSRPLLNNSSASSSSYMTPHGGSPMAYSQHMHSGEVPLAYNNMQMHEQTPGQYSSVYNLNMHQAMHQSPAPTIPVPQQLTITPTERNQLYDPTLRNPQQQMTPMNTRRGRSSLEATASAPVPVTVPTPSPEKRTRGRAKKPSVDSQPQENQETIEPVQQEVIATINPVVENPPNQQIDATPVVQSIPSESTTHHATSSVNNDNHIEVNPFVSKSNEEDQKDTLGEGGEKRDSRSPSVGSSSAKSESVIKEIPLSGDRNRLSRSKSPKSRWHHSPSPRESEQQVNQMTTIDEENSSALKTAHGDERTVTESVGKSSVDASTAEEQLNSTRNEKEQVESTALQQKQTTSNESSIKESLKEEKISSEEQQHSKINRSQGLTSTTSSSLMKGLNRSTSNRMNLSSDILKTLIPDISLAPESVIETELEGSNNESNTEEHIENSPNQAVLETSIGSGLLLNESTNIGDLSDQKQQRNRTVVIDLAVDSSSLNDDLVGGNVEARKKLTGIVPVRMASFESKTLLDGKTNALMMDEPVRVRDVSAAREPATKIVYILGLTRPFTLPQLKELLGRYGTLVDGELWLDKIKSQCFAMYNTLDEAQNAREGLDGCRWPSSNPKTLIVRFGRQDEFEFSKSRDLPPDQMSSDAGNATDEQTQDKQNFNNKPITASRRSASPADDSRANNKKARPVASGDVREWDIPKLQQQKETSNNERQIIEEPAVKDSVPPAKGLDDYFRKTKAKPAIYWLQLTEEQSIDRALQKAQRKADEEKGKRQVDQKTRESGYSKDSKPRSNNNGNSTSYSSYRRSPSPKDKRKRASSSSSPIRRDNKRH